MQENLDQIKLVIALRTARAAVGWSQDELATQLGIAKTTIARMETFEGGLRAEQLTAIVRLYKSAGVDIDFMFEDEVKVRVSKQALEQAQRRLMDDAFRRSDRKKPAGGIINAAMSGTYTTFQNGAGPGLLSQPLIPVENPDSKPGLLNADPKRGKGLLGQ